MPQHHISTLQRLKESPQWILIPRREGDVIFVAALAATSILCLISLFFNSILL